MRGVDLPVSTSQPDSESASGSAPEPGRGARGLAAAALSLIATVVGIWALAAAQAFLVPIVLALFGVILVNGLDSVWAQVPVIGKRVPRFLATPLSAVTLFLIVGGSANLVLVNAKALSADAPRYQEKIDELYVQAESYVTELGAKVGLFESPAGAESTSVGEDGDAPEQAEEPVGIVDRWVDSFDIGALAGWAASGLVDVTGNGLLVAVYLFFFLLERRTFANKIQNMFGDEDRRRRVRGILERVEADVRRYVGLKVIVSLLTAIPSYLLMVTLELPYAVVFAALIFALNFIPNLGSLVATLLPTFLALVAFDELWQVGVLVAGLVAIQLIIANVVEPPMMGKTLNMSPVVVIVSLIGWSALWGIAGAFLCVPMTAMLLIVLANVPQTRWIAVLLSSDGELKEAA